MRGELPALLPRLERLIGVLAVFHTIDHGRDISGTLDTEISKLLEHPLGIWEFPLFVNSEGAVVILEVEEVAWLVTSTHIQKMVY